MKNKRTKSRIVLALMLIVTIAAGVLGVTGMLLPGYYKLQPWLPTADANAWPETLPLGLDLRGGVYVEYSAARPAEETEASFGDLIEGTMAVIQARLANEGYTECNTQTIGDDGIRVEIPDVSDPNAILDLIGEPALLEFCAPDGTVFMTGEKVATAVGVFSQANGQPVIEFSLNSEGTALFREMTTRYINQVISIYLDGELLIAPQVSTVISDGKGVITGMESLAEAQKIAAQIQSGALPLVLTQQKVDTVSATLGDDALSTSVTAAMIGIVLIMALMIVRYRLNGVVASWALTIYVILLFLMIALLPGIQLTLPGLAGIVLGIGMAVDANVIIFERFNEEVRAGRTLKASVRAGFKNAASAIVDANVTTMIAAVVLWIFGTGSIKGFGVTLGLSVVVSMFTAVVVTRFLMKQLIQANSWKPGAFTSGVTADKEGK